MAFFRIYHVLFGGAALAAYFTAEELGLVHAWLGYGIAALIAIRLISGLLGVRGFQFRRLMPSLASPPLGQTGVRHPAISRGLAAALLLCVTGAATTGIAMDGGGTLVGQSIRADDREGYGEDDRGHDGRDEDENGRFSAFGLIQPAYADDDGEGGEEREEGPLGELHETFGSLILPLAALHALYLLLFRLDLARFMLFLQRRRA